MRGAALWPLLAAALVLGAPERGAGGEGGLRVELDVFSGRPNPSWTLDAAGGAELRALVEVLAPATLAPPAFDGLGYRGFVVSDPADPDWRLLAYRGLVRLRRGGREEVRADPDRRIERWLIGTAGPAVDPGLRPLLGL